jgi:hypothetical protein
MHGARDIHILFAGRAVEGLVSTLAGDRPPRTYLAPVKRAHADEVEEGQQSPKWKRHQQRRSRLTPTSARSGICWVAS